VCRVVEPYEDTGEPVTFDPTTAAIFVMAPDQLVDYRCPEPPEVEVRLPQVPGGPVEEPANLEGAGVRDEEEVPPPEAPAQGRSPAGVGLTPPGPRGFSGVPGALGEDYKMGRYRHRVRLNDRHLMDLNTHSDGEDHVVEYYNWISVGRFKRHNKLTFIAGDDQSREGRPNCDEFELRHVSLEFEW